MCTINTTGPKYPIQLRDSTGQNTELLVIHLITNKFLILIQVPFQELLHAKNCMQENVHSLVCKNLNRLKWFRGHHRPQLNNMSFKCKTKLSSPTRRRKNKYIQTTELNRLSHLGKKIAIRFPVAKVTRETQCYKLFIF